MSAKRLKLEGMNGERASRTRARSFPSPPAVAAGDGNDRHHEQEDDGRPCADNLPSPGDDKQRRGGLSSSRGENLVRIESALSLHSSFRKPGSLLSFDEVYGLLAKVQLLHAADAAVAATGAPTPAADEPTKARKQKGGVVPGEGLGRSYAAALSEEERHLYHLLRVGVPMLYNVRLLKDDEAAQRRHNGLFSSSSSGRSTTNDASDGALSLSSQKMMMSGFPRRYYLEKGAFPGNRIKELRRLVREYDPQAIADDDDDGILAAIVNHRDAPSSASSSSQRVDSSRRRTALDGTGSDEAVIRAGMTIDERVGARERARLKRSEDVAKARDDAIEAGETTMDRAWLVRVSDALWRHSSDILVSQNRGAAQQSFVQKRKVSFCTLTLMDAVSVLKKALASPGASSHDKKTTSHALVEAILELTKLGPKWIQLTGTGDKKERASKDDTVWIYHSHYQEARALVSGKRPATMPALPGEGAVQLGAAKGGEKSASKRPLDTPAKVASRSSIVTSDDYDASSNRLKKPRQALQSDDASTPLRRKQEPLSTFTNGVTPPPASAAKKPALRINPHLILSDADYSTCQSALVLRVLGRSYGSNRTMSFSFHSQREAKSSSLRSLTAPVVSRSCSTKSMPGSAFNGLDHRPASLGT
jgi:hypothetical protein